MQSTRYTASLSSSWRRIALATLVTGILDALFATTLGVVVYHNTTFTRLWQGVAGVVVGPRAVGGGAAATALGLLIHFAVACCWSTVFLVLLVRLPVVARVLEAPLGTLRVAATYGPCVWLMMSLVAIPLAMHRAPKITSSWWAQLIGHAVFVGLPIVASVGGRWRTLAEWARAVTLPAEAH